MFNNNLIKLNKRQKGFTLIELLVVIAIIGILSSVVLASLTTARMKARDAQRLSDLKQLELALQFYYDEHGYYPKESGGSNGKVGEGGGLDTMLSQYFSSGVPVDPLGPGNSNYYYYYDGLQWCTNGSDPKIAVIFARGLEQASGNPSNICSVWGGEGGAGGANAWHIKIGPSDG